MFSRLSFVIYCCWRKNNFSEIFSHFAVDWSLVLPLHASPNMATAFILDMHFFRFHLDHHDDYEIFIRKIFFYIFYFLESSTKISTSCHFLHFNSFLTFMMSIWYLWMLTILCAWHPEIGSEIDFHSQISLKQFEWILFAYKLSTSHTLSKLSFPQRDIKVIFIYKHSTSDYMLILPSGDVFKKLSSFITWFFQLSRTAFQI